MANQAKGYAKMIKRHDADMKRLHLALEAERKGKPSRRKAPNAWGQDY